MVQDFLQLGGGSAEGVAGDLLGRHQGQMHVDVPGGKRAQTHNHNLQGSESDN